MKTYKFNDGNKIPQLGLGTFLNTDVDILKNTLTKAFELGYRHIDTAQGYNNEAIIGDIIKDSGLNIKNLFITTKIKCHETPEQLKISLEESFLNLQTDFIDLVLIHWPSHDYKLNYQTYQVLEEYKDEGKIGSIGVSNFTIDHLKELLKVCKYKPVINQVELHPNLTQEPMQTFLKQNDIAIGSYGQFMKGQVFEGSNKEVLERVATKYNATIAQIVIAWGLARNIIMIPMSTNEKNLETNLLAKDIVLNKEDIDLINGLNKGRRVYTDPENNNIFMKR
ncbi:MAG TPA: aldo/keto reductase [Haploplasma sp.]|nr:aldo/keto reductase [Haploplasma sp.]